MNYEIYYENHHYLLSTYKVTSYNFGNICGQAFNNSSLYKPKMIRNNTAPVISGATKDTSKEKLYHELFFENGL